MVFQGKTSWPELVGRNGNEAARIIKQENENIKDAVVILEGTSVAEIYICTRVYVWVNYSGSVTQVPTVG